MTYFSSSSVRSGSYVKSFGSLRVNKDLSLSSSLFSSIRGRFIGAVMSSGVCRLSFSEDEMTGCPEHFTWIAVWTWTKEGNWLNNALNLNATNNLNFTFTSSFRFRDWEWRLNRDALFWNWGGTLAAHIPCQRLSDRRDKSANSKTSVTCFAMTSKLSRCSYLRTLWCTDGVHRRNSGILQIQHFGKSHFVLG